MKTMNCEQLRELLDQYLDNELDAQTKSLVDGHAKSCPECGEMLDSAIKLATMCAELDEGLSVPLDVQAAWRSAVRAEARKQKRGGMGRWIAGFTSAAAVIALLIGGTAMMQNGMIAPLSQLNEGANRMTNAVMAPQAKNASLASGTGEYDYADMDMEESPVYAIDGAITDDAIAPEPTGEPAGADATVSEREQKVIKNASRTIETSNYDADMQVIRSLIIDMGGLEDDSYEYNPQKAGRTEFRNANLNVRIPTDMVEEFLQELDAQVPVVSRSENSQTITTQYYDMSARLEQQKGYLADLTELRAQAQGVDEIMSVQQQIRDVQADIESMEGVIKSWDSRINFTQVSLYVQEVADKNQVQSIDTEDLGARIRASFAESINLFTQFVQDMAVFIVLVWPWLLVLIVVILIVTACVKRRRKNR